MQDITLQQNSIEVKNMFPNILVFIIILRRPYHWTYSRTIMYMFCLLFCLSSAYQIIVSDKDGKNDLCKYVTNDIKQLERKIDKQFEKMVTTLQQSIDNKCSKGMLICT